VCAGCLRPAQVANRYHLGMTSTAPTVLVVDDEEDLRDAMRRMLERRGFATLTAGDPAEAEAVCRAYDGAIDVLLTDLTLPGASGGEVARLIQAMRPELRVVYVSGLPRDLAIGNGLVGPDAALVQKPFTSERLAAEIHRALDAVDGAP
jgi:CheY-like chemotaxis protein